MLKKVCNLIFILYAYADATKMIHYSTKSNHTHQLCDDIRDAILEFVDELAEQSFGYIGNPNFADMKLTTDIQRTDDLKTLCSMVSKSIESYRSDCEKDDKMASIVSLIDDFNGKLSKLSFLATFDKYSKK